jgi:hypothetical protein
MKPVLPFRDNIDGHPKLLFHPAAGRWHCINIASRAEERWKASFPAIEVEFSRQKFFCFEHIGQIR